MGRLACVNVRVLPLQLLLRRRPDWRAEPAVVVAEEKAQARILCVNGRALRRGIRTGMRYAAALSLAGDLRAAVVPPHEVAAGVRGLTRRLHRFSPHVEPSAEEPGTFWLDASGLERLHGGLEHWAERVRAQLGQAGFDGSVVVGFTRFGTYAVAKTCRTAGVFADPDRERRAARQVALERLGIAPELRDALHQLGVRTVAELLALPSLGLLERFGPEAWRLHRQAAALLPEPLQPKPEEQSIRQELLLEYPETDAARLMFLVKRRFPALLAALGDRGESLKTLHLRLLLEGREPEETTVRPAVPTRNAALILDLVRLRLEGLKPEGGVTGIQLLAEGEPSRIEQLSLFDVPPRRDPEAAARALARLRAEFGEEAVVWAELREGHLPEARFAWEPLERLKPPAPEPVARRSLVRRVYAHPPALPARPGAANPAELGRALGGGPLARLEGPAVISGGWWAAGQNRGYYFAETKSGDLLWLLHDRHRDRWFLQGRVE